MHFLKPWTKLNMDSVSKILRNNSKGGKIVFAVDEITAYFLIYVNYKGCHGVYCSYSNILGFDLYERRIQLKNIFEESLKIKSHQKCTF